MGFDWRALAAQELERHFNPRVAVPDAQAHLDRFAARSAAARGLIPGRYDLRYGKRSQETLDVHAPPGSEGLPLVVFLHGGYWRALDKSDHSFVAPPLLQAGAVVANVNYDLCPTVTLDEMVEEIGNSLRFCAAHAESWGADPRRMVLMGHSAGAHLAAEMLLADPPPARGIAALIGLTGIYEPEIILGVSVNEEAQVTPETAARRSCLGRPFQLRPRALLAAGGDEPEGWRGQTTAFAAACRDAGLDTRSEIVPGANHFTVLERALDPADPLHGVLRDYLT